ncbi:hypothetical protein AGMMS50233_06060 [Endomicrobiia bacterium]|nr:hypothetical protein AGMMS50233_06060 [Endomicrobiia bacterium]
MSACAGCDSVSVKEKETRKLQEKINHLDGLIKNLPTNTNIDLAVKHTFEAAIKVIKRAATIIAKGTATSADYEAAFIDTKEAADVDTKAIRVDTLDAAYATRAAINSALAAEHCIFTFISDDSIKDRITESAILNANDANQANFYADCVKDAHAAKAAAKAIAEIAKDLAGKVKKKNKTK